MLPLVLNDDMFGQNMFNTESVISSPVTKNVNEVFHLRDNIFSYDDAKAACKAYNAQFS